MHYGSSFWNRIDQKQLRMENIQNPSNEPTLSQTNLQEEKQSEDHRQGKEEETGRASKNINWQAKRQTAQYTVNKQEHRVQFSPSQPNTSRSVWSQTQPIPFSRAKASGTMVTVTMWSISIPEDSSVREVEQTVASISHYHVHISELAYTHTPATHPYGWTYLNAYCYYCHILLHWKSLLIITSILYVIITKQF